MGSAKTLAAVAIALHSTSVGATGMRLKAAERLPGQVLGKGRRPALRPGVTAAAPRQRAPASSHPAVGLGWE
eukprot:CAMPEP_0118867274 /NCGR_PEP_ID=MMETSP1163-20130328/10932_1 /TAXON_ID=124430 /ORGANISM="Phaeomonas parva, Strain CCMP2877" /LENGTH=71 /DNA_ID=CAMNT_0006801673 /DNA_START=50 /DNA_END=265 /DNA_ORIENTATION=-